MNLDYFFFQQINNLAGRWVCLDAIGIFLASYFQYVLAGVLLIFLFLGKDRAQKIKNRIMVGLSLLAAFISRFILTEVIRWFWYRPRPFLAHPVHLLIFHDSTGSFPSGHMAFLFAASAVIYLYNRKAGWLFFIASVLIGLARIFVGVHYPSDILAGAIVGILSGWVMYKLVLMVKNKE